MTTQEQPWLIVPRDPLIFRDGKPFTGNPGERANSLGFPYPSTISGAVRTRSGSKPNGEFDVTRIEELLEKSIRGPMLVELNGDDQISASYFPVPADALYVRKQPGDGLKLYALSPIDPPPGTQSDLKEINLIGYPTRIEEKPEKDKAPHYWTWSTLKTWLEEAKDAEGSQEGLGELKRDKRVHVSIRESQTAEDGALFQTSGLEFVKPTMNEVRQLGLAVFTDAALTAGVDTLGGERRMVRWQTAETMEAVMPDPDCPPTIVEKILKSRHCRLVLITPAHFTDGFLPKHLKVLGVTVEGVALPRYQTISGWDYKANEGKGQPKPTRRLAPAGSVYYLDLTKIKDDKDVVEFIKFIWLRAVSDEEQDRRDGFGIALLGTWDGTPKKMEVK